MTRPRCSPGPRGAPWKRRAFAVAALGLLGHWRGAVGQVTWGPGPLHLSDVDDLSNHQRLHDLLRRAYFKDYGRENRQHALMPAIRAEIAEYRQRAQTMPSLALAVGMAKYHFAWYREGGSEMDELEVEDAANLLYASIKFSGCDRADLTLQAFVERMCGARWPYAILAYSELGREYASRYLTEEAAAALEKAVFAFDQMKRLPYYSPLVHWQSPYDIHFNEEWFPGASRSGPVWDNSLVPLALALESNFETMAAELRSILERGLFDDLHFEGVRAEGRDHAPDEGRRVVELTAVEAQPAGGPWSTAACREAPRTCAFLADRPELRGCRHAGAALVRLRAGGKRKPRYGAAPKMTCHLTLEADPAARMSVGNQTLGLPLGKAVVFDDTFIQQEWHSGVRGERYILQVDICHPCEDSQKSLYSGAVACPSMSTPSQPVVDGGAKWESHHSAGAGLPAALPVPFAAAALWAAGLPELARCAGGIGESCPPDTQHGGPNPLSALSTWNYALNNLKAALIHTDTPVDPAVLKAIAELQGNIQGFFGLPAIDRFLPIVTAASQLVGALEPWLRQQPPTQLPFAPPPAALAAGPLLPCDGQLPPGGVTFPLANGLQMPAVGFGTWKLEGPACYQAVRWALEQGIFHLDTAEAYGNEAEIGRAIQDSGVPRGSLFLVSKATSVAMGMADPSYLETILAGQLQALQTDYLDVYMLHAAGVQGEQLQAVWRNMEKMYDSGRVKALGVSNFGVDALEELWASARIKPVYLQNIFKVYKPGEQIAGTSTMSVLEWARQHDVRMVGYSVINSWPQLLPPLQDPHVLAIAQRHGRTPSQVLHRWALQHGVAVIPKASSRERIRENSALFDFALPPADVALLDGLATLSESTGVELRPLWCADVYGLQQAPRHPQAPSPGLAGGPAAAAPPPAASPPAGADAGAAFRELARGAMCERDTPGAKAEPFTLGGGGHELARCQAACAALEQCRFITFYHSTGFCHMYRSCQEQKAVGDSAVIYSRA